MSRVPFVRSGAWRAIAAAVALFSLASCRPAPKEEAPKEAGPVLVGPENVIALRRETIQTGPRVAGSLQARRQAAVRAEVGGSVISVRAEVGEVVKPGQLLAQIEASALGDALVSAQSGVTSARADLQNARRQLERTRALVQGGALSERELEVAQSAVASAEARLKDTQSRVSSAQKQVRSTVVRAPFKGVVSQRQVNMGDVVGLGTALFTIIDPSSMRLEASVPSEQLSALKVGAPVLFSVRGYPDQTFTGKIERIAPAADPVTRQIGLLVSIPNPGGRLIAGLFAEGRVASVQREGLVAPASAVEQIGETASVLRIRNDVVEQVPVKVGLRDDSTERVEILSGLEPGDLVLVGSGRGIPSGTKVRLTGGAAGAAAGGAAGMDGATPVQPGGAPSQAGGAPGQSGGAPGQSGGAPGQPGGAPGQAGSAPGQAGSAPAQAGGAHAAPISTGK